MTTPTTTQDPARDLEEQVVRAYRKGRLSLSEAAEQLSPESWAWLDLLRQGNEPLNVQLEDLVDSRPALRGMAGGNSKPTTAPRAHGRDS